MTENIYLCSCGAQFKLLSSFNKHQKYDCNNFRDITTHQCPDCGVKFTHERNLIRHMKKNCTSKISLGTSKKFYSCTFQGCKLQFYKLTSLTDHVEYFHNVEISTEKFNFPNYDEFLKWKQKEEQSTFSYFSKRHSAPSNSDDPKASYETYYCQLHGSRKPHHQVKSDRKNKKGRAKTGMVCYAHMFVKIESDESVKVKYVSSHTHPLNADNTKFQPLPQTLKTEILQLNALNMPLNEIHKRVTRCDLSRENRENPTKGREHFIKLHNIRYLLKTVAEKNEEPDEGSAISAIVNNWCNESYNPIMIYKPAGEGICIGPYWDLPEDDFLFGFQTKEERDFMSDKDILFVDFLYDAEGYGAQILTVVAGCETSEHPVAHFILSNIDDTTLTLCFTALAQNSPSFTLKSIMATDVRIFKIIKKIFPDCRCFFCHSFVLNQWSKKLEESTKNQSYHEEIMKKLIKILKESSEDQFTAQTKYFCSKYNSTIPSFVNYFHSYYLKSEHLPLWSSIWREDLSINNNSLVDHFYDFFKEKYLKRITEKTLDKLIIAFGEIEKDYYAKSKNLENDVPDRGIFNLSGDYDQDCDNVQDVPVNYEESEISKLEKINNNLARLSVLLEDKFVQEKLLDKIDESLEELVNECNAIKNESPAELIN